MSISLRGRAWGLQRLPSLKYNVQKRESRLNLGHDVAKNTHDIQNCLKKVVEHRIPYRKVSMHVCLSPPGVELVCSKDCFL